MLPWFKNWFNSPYYHHLYFNRDEKEAAEFIDKLISHLHPLPGVRMLDVACGKGRHSLQLSHKGFDVTGIDLSEDSINEALQFENETLHFFQHDMRLPCWINYFDYAFNFFTSFGYFNTQRENDNAIRTIAQSLKPRGIFVMDYLNVHYAEDHMIHQTEKDIEGINFFITKWYDEHHFFKKIMVEDEQLDEPLVFTEKVAKFSLGDFTDMFAYQGLQIKEIFGDYAFSSYHVKKSPRLIMIAEKIR
ncbi:MAG: class I SAM-dependent methyltransferase [Ferruginibacter sp.]